MCNNFKYHIKDLVISRSLLKKLFQLIDMVDNVLKSDSQLDERVVSLYLDLVIKVDIVVGTHRCILTSSSYLDLMYVHVPGTRYNI